MAQICIDAANVPMSTVTGIVAYVTRNVFSRARTT